MGIISRVVVKMTRDWQIHLIQLIVFTVIGTVLLNFLMISQSIAVNSNLVKSSLPLNINLKMLQIDENENQEKITKMDVSIIEELKFKYGDLIDSVQYSIPSTIGLSEDFQSVGDNYVSNIGEVSGEKKSYGYIFNSYGVSSLEIPIIASKEVILSEGRNFSEDEIKLGKNVTMISDEFAIKNNLSVNQEIEANFFKYKISNDGTFEFYEDNVVPLRIIGIYKLPDHLKSNKYSIKNMNPMYFADIMNAFYLPNETILKYSSREQLSDFNSMMDIQIVVKSVDEMQALIELLQEDINTNYIEISSNFQTFQQLNAPLSEVVKSIQFLQMIVLISFGGVAILFSTYNVNRRKKEIAIYYALGCKKIEVLLQLVLETILILIISWVFSLILTEFLVGQWALHIIPSSEASVVSLTSLNTRISYSEIVNSIKILISIEYFFFFLMTTTFVTLVPTIITLTYFLQLNPKEILID